MCPLALAQGETLKGIFPHLLANNAHDYQLMFAYYHAAFPASENVPMIFSMYITYTTSNRYALSQLK